MNLTIMDMSEEELQKEVDERWQRLLDLEAMTNS